MASSSTTTPDTQINLKVNHDGVTKKLKLPLRDLGASTLENKLRAGLFIDPSTECQFERYSDSAASYVVLDPRNVPVYKQLFRAAKAKQKLKLRVTTLREETVEEHEDTEESKLVPKPVTVEDVPESTEAAEPKLVKEESTIPTPSPVASTLPIEDPAPQFQFNRTVSLRPRLDEEAPRQSFSMLKDRVSVAALMSQEDPTYAPETTLPTAPVELPKCQVETPPVVPRGATFAVCCNSCDRTIPDSHYHCSTCDDGDFDLCQECVDMGITCYGADHWLIRRFIKNGMIVTSTTERIAPKPKAKPVVVKSATAPAVPPVDFGTRFSVFDLPQASHAPVRTCNNCVGELPETEFVHCTSCYDFDLCKLCFVKNEHGHHPKHGFVPAAEGTIMSADITQKLAPGRNQKHNAICDGCDKYINGIRHKCLDCPDWDYCSGCVVNAGFIHPNHRFVPIYETIGEPRQLRPVIRTTHSGICCDGPLCRTAAGSGRSRYIVGDRYKCAVCNDTDFCANCEASPANTHNKTHPLIKFKTPVRHVNVTTTAEYEDGKRPQTMGDRSRQSLPSIRSRASEATLTNRGIAINHVQTVVDVKPTEPETSVKAEEKEEIKQEPVVEEKPIAEAPKTAPSADDLVAVYESDTVADGTVLAPNLVFEQTWVLRNAGTTPWPAGCSVKFVGGDYMGHVDPNHPAGIRELVSASESTICYEALAPGEEFHFTVLLRTPPREGKVISYWRLTTKEGLKFGHRLWCDVDVQVPKAKEGETTETKEEAGEIPLAEKPDQSQMIFPKLEKESPASSIPALAPADKAEEEPNDFEECEDDEWADDDSDDGFMTDEEYDILDASDEEYLEEQQKLVRK